MPKKNGATIKLMAKKKGAINRVAGSTSSTKESPIPPSKTTRKMARKTSTAGRELYLKKKKAFMHCSLSSLLKILKASTIWVIKRPINTREKRIFNKIKIGRLNVGLAGNRSIKAIQAYNTKI